MPFPTTTRSELRHQICTELGMPFYITYGDKLTADSIDATKLIIQAPQMTQEADYWNNQWYYQLVSGDVRKILDSATTGVLTLERAVSNSSDLDFEVMSVFSPYQVHSAINRAIAAGYPSFFDVYNDTSKAVVEDTVTYDLSALSPRPWIVTKVFVEQVNGQVLPDPTTIAGTFDSITFAANVVLPDLTHISVYDGTGKGTLRTATKTGQTISFTAFTALDTTSKFYVWNANEDAPSWYRILPVRFDQREYPSQMYFSQDYSGWRGHRIRVQYIAQPETLAADSDETVVPSEFLISKALEILSTSKLNDNKVDRQKWQLMAQMYQQTSEMTRLKLAFQSPSGTLWTEEDAEVEDLDNPLGW